MTNLYIGLAAFLLGFAWAFERLNVPAWHQIFLPAGLGWLILWSGVAYLFPQPK